MEQIYYGNGGDLYDAKSDTFSRKTKAVTWIRKTLGYWLNLGTTSRIQLHPLTTRGLSDQNVTVLDAIKAP